RGWRGGRWGGSGGVGGAGAQAGAERRGSSDLCSTEGGANTRGRHSFPTRRSSDLGTSAVAGGVASSTIGLSGAHGVDATGRADSWGDDTGGRQAIGDLGSTAPPEETATRTTSGSGDVTEPAIARGGACGGRGGNAG